jgi:hypothetical protein
MVDATGKVVKLFDQLIVEGENIKQTCRKLYFSGQKKAVSPEVFTEWKTKCLSLLKSTFGSSSPQFDSFTNAKFFDYYNATQVYLGILKAGRQDVRKGYFFHKDLMLSVNIYDALLTRARKLIESEQLRKAEALLEAVLREVLGKICHNRKIPLPGDVEVSDLADLLVKAEIIPEAARTSLVNLHRKFGRQDAGAPELAQAHEWIASFLNEYLGGQILILN